MILHLLSVLSGKTGTMQIEVPLESDSFPSGSFHGAEVRYALAGDRNFINFTVLYQGNLKVSVEANVSLVCRTLCSKCLQPVEFPLSLELSREIDFNLTEEQRREAMDEMNFIHDFDLDTEVLLQEEIMLNLPMRVLCREDCKGLCPLCGIDRNKETCHCDDMPKDPRMAAISELFRQSILENSK